ncbi:hypothetical protein LUZ60_005116 [Juncus effusus]|nr:hypothetical protein LUZ60_005116 [Juncus effusus]
MIVGGESLVSSPPVFSHDGKKLLVCTGCTVSVFSSATGMLVTELEGHTDRVTSVIVVVPVDGTTSEFLNYCWTCSLDGTIIYWDFSAPELIKKVNVELPIHSMVIPYILGASLGSTNNSSTNNYAIISVEDSKKTAGNDKNLPGKIQIYDLTTSRRVGSILAETRNPETLSISKSGEYVGIKNRKRLHIWKLPSTNSKFNPEKIKKLKLHHTKTLTSLAFHPTENTVAGGDITGRVLIWCGVGRNRFVETQGGEVEMCGFAESGGGKVKTCGEDRAGVRGDDDADVCTTWDWHAKEIQFLVFSSDGAYLFSGGKEGVIVVWQLETGKKKLKPHFGSPLMHFSDSPDPSLSCVCCEDNSIHILQMPGLEIIKSISGIKSPFTLPDINGESQNNKIGFDRSNGLVALPTKDYHVQFYNLFENTEVSNVQVIERNYEPVDETMVFVSLVEVSEDGSMMCTVEEKLPEDCLGGQVRLKFWTRSLHKLNYSLSTVIYEPHSDGRISDVAFWPGRNMAVTSSFGGNFKVWVNNSINQTGGEKKEKDGWKCQSVGSYKGRQMSAAAFSEDGSVLAVAAENVITLWDPDSNVLLAVIGDSLSPIRKLAFVGISEYIVSVSFGTKPQLAVWNLSNLSLHWSYKLLVEDVCAMTKEPYFAVLAILNSSDDSTSNTKDGLIILFNIENPVPVSTWFVKKAKGGRISFVKKTNKGQKQLLAYINGIHEYIVFDPNNKDEGLIDTTSHKRRQVHSDEAVSGGYASMYGELASLNKARNEKDLNLPFVPQERPWETIFNGSSHVLPPLTRLCSSFLESLLEKKPISNI